MNELLEHLSRFRRRLRLRDGWLAAQSTLWLALAAAALALLVGRIWPVENIRPIALIPAAAWLLGVLGWALFRRLPAMKVARKVDRELGLKERLSTSLALRSGDSLPTAVQASFRPELVDRLHGDAMSAARAVDPRRDFPLSWLKRPLMMAGGLALAVVLLVALPNPMDRVIAERQAVKEAAKKAAQKIDDLKKEVEQSQELSPEEREALRKQLEELARQLRENPGDREKALADLSKAEEELRKQLRPNEAARQAALAAMAAQLQELAKSQDQRQPGDLSAAAGDLQKLAEELAKMTPEQQQALAQQLAQMAARAGQAGEGELAQALAEMSNAAQQGDAQAANRAAQKAGQAMKSAGQKAAAQNAIQRALAQMQAGRQGVARAGQSGNQMAGNPGQGNNPGQGQGQPGQGQGQGQQAGGGGGSNANQLPPNQGGKIQLNPPKGSKPGSTGEDLSSQVYAPQGAGGKNQVFISGQDTGQGTTEERQTKDPLPGAANPALVPYNEVFQNYQDAANQAVEQSYIPEGLKDYIKNYFSSLEP